MRKVKSYIKNSTDLINILEELEVPPDAYLITLDIESLYTNISHDEAITTFLKKFIQHPKKVFLLDLLKYVLKNNIFKFNNLTFTQLCGVAMGTKLAPALATIYIGDLEENFIKHRTRQPLLWVRYIDDVFTIWPHSKEDFEYFLADLNRAKDRIHFTANISTQSVDFLDLTIYKAPEFLTTQRLSTTIYYKPTNTFSFPLGSSYMPRHIHKGIAIGELTRIIRNTTSPTLYKHYKNRLLMHLRRRGYGKNITKALKRYTHAKRQALLKKQTKKI